MADLQKYRLINWVHKGKFSDYAPFFHLRRQGLCGCVYCRCWYITEGRQGTAVNSSSTACIVCSLKNAVAAALLQTCQYPLYLSTQYRFSVLKSRLLSPFHQHRYQDCVCLYIFLDIYYLFGLVYATLISVGVLTVPVWHSWCMRQEHSILRLRCRGPRDRRSRERSYSWPAAMRSYSSALARCWTSWARPSSSWAR